MRSVLIRGDGIAACCCAHLLTAAGVSVTIEAGARARVPAIMLSDTALGLLRDVFGRPDLLAGRPRIERRVVAWGAAAQPVEVPHAAVVVSEHELLAALREGLRIESGPIADEGHDFLIHTTPALPPSVVQHRFGARRASAVEVTLRDANDVTASWIESTPDGWLFVAPNPAGAVWLLGVGAPLDELLASSRLIAPRLDTVGAASGAFDCCPRILAPLCADDWLACGTSAIAFDPICGDGAAQATREGILASAVIVARSRGGDTTRLMSHYQAMMTAAMRRHLGLCVDFYSTGGDGPWWRAERAALLAGAPRSWR